MLLKDTRNNTHVGSVHVNHLLTLLIGMNCLLCFPLKGSDPFLLSSTSVQKNNSFTLNST